MFVYLKKLLIFIVGLLLVSQYTSALAGSLVGSTDSHDINSGDMIEGWTVISGATLNINQDGSANGVTLSTDSHLNASGGVINGMVSVAESTVKINNSILKNMYGGALKVVEDLSNSKTSGIYLTNSLLSGTTFGLSMVGASVVKFSNTTVMSTSTGSNAVRHFGGNLSILNGSSILGDVNGITVEVDQNGLSGEPNPAFNASILVDGSTVTGTTGSAIVVGKYSSQDISVVDIDVNNGSQLHGGNGNILTVAENSIANLSINNSHLTGNLVNESGSHTSLILHNASSITGTLSNVSSVDLDSTSTWNVTGDSSVSSLKNDGTVFFSSESTSRTVSVNGNYSGNNGLLVFNAVLGDDSSPTDKLEIIGDTSGNTNVRVNNLGGIGKQTLDGIELISVQGNSGGTFTQQGRIVAGVYDYHLQRGDDNNESNWYLSSEKDDSGVGDVDLIVHTLRPEAGSYIANISAANQMFIITMNDRLGEIQGEDGDYFWMRNIGRHIYGHDSSGQLQTQSNSYTLQLGGDLRHLSFNGTDRLNLGVMSGYGYNTSNTDSNVTHYRSSGTVNGYTLGVYGNWFANTDDKTGPYSDFWALYSWFDNSINGEGLASENYRSQGLTTSAEVGYIMTFWNSASTRIYLQPKGQLIWMGVKADDHRETDGTYVAGQGNDNIQSRIGLRAFADFHSLNTMNDSNSIRPFAEMNWVHNTHNYGVNMDGEIISGAGNQNFSEVKLGLEGELNDSLVISSSVAQSTGTDNFSDSAFSLDVKYRF